MQTYCRTCGNLVSDTFLRWGVCPNCRQQGLLTNEDKARFDYRHVDKSPRRRANTRTESHQKQFSMDDLDGLSGVAFEEFLSHLFQRLGYSVSTTKRSGDQGVDLILERDATKTVVQAKRYHSTVGNTAVQEAISGKAFIKAGKCMVVTNSTFTSSAQELAGATGTILWDRNVLQALVQFLY